MLKEKRQKANLKSHHGAPRVEHRADEAAGRHAARDVARGEQRVVVDHRVDADEDRALPEIEIEEES